MSTTYHDFARMSCQIANQHNTLVANMAISVEAYALLALPATWINQNLVFWCDGAEQSQALKWMIGHTFAADPIRDIMSYCMVVKQHRAFSDVNQLCWHMLILG